MTKPILNLLLVDDDDIYGETLARALQKRQYNVYFSVSLAAALDQAHNVTFDYAVVDLRIGTDSGLELIGKLLQINPHINIVMLTGYASVATAVEAIKLGATHYLTKPATAEEILLALDKNSGDADIEIQERPMSVRRLEWEHLQKVLIEYDGNISAAARALKMHRRTLQRKLAKKPMQH